MMLRARRGYVNSAVIAPPRAFYLKHALAHSRPVRDARLPPHSALAPATRQCDDVDIGPLSLTTVLLSITRNPRAGFDRGNSSELLLWARKRQQRQLGIILWEGQFLKKGAIFDRF